MYVTFHVAISHRWDGPTFALNKRSEWVTRDTHGCSLWMSSWNWALSLSSLAPGCVVQWLMTAVSPPGSKYWHLHSLFSLSEQNEFRPWTFGHWFLSCSATPSRGRRLTGVSWPESGARMLHSVPDTLCKQLHSLGLQWSSTYKMRVLSKPDGELQIEMIVGAVLRTRKLRSLLRAAATKL